MNARAISPAGLALIQDAEGFRVEPGQLPDGSWVVGYGHVRAEAGEPVTQAYACDLLSMDLAPIEGVVNGKVTQPLTQSQFDALVSFVFSVGVEAFAQSQVLRRLNAGDHIAAACAMDAWRKSDASGELEVVDALVRRRAQEKAMFLKAIACEAAPSAFVRAKLDHAALILGAPIKYSPAPALGSVPMAPAKVAPSARLHEVMSARPETQALLLTQVVVDDVEAGAEIATAHARPVARNIEARGIEARGIAIVAAELPIDRRIRAAGAERNPPAPRPLENWGLVGLLLFGLGLVGLAGSLVLEAHADAVTIAGGAALAAPGIAAVLMAAFGLARAPHAKARAA